MLPNAERPNRPSSSTGRPSAVTASSSYRRLAQPFPLNGELGLKRKLLAAIEADHAATTSEAKAA